MLVHVQACDNMLNAFPLDPSYLVSVMFSVIDVCVSLRIYSFVVKSTHEKNRDGNSKKRNRKRDVLKEHEIVFLNSLKCLGNDKIFAHHQICALHSSFNTFLWHDRSYYIFNCTHDFIIYINIIS